jgi:hypothetical protein
MKKSKKPRKNTKNMEKKQKSQKIFVVKKPRKMPKKTLFFFENKKQIMVRGENQKGI